MTRTEVLKLSCFFLQTLNLQKRLAESRYGGNRNFSLTSEPVLISKIEIYLKILSAISTRGIFTRLGGRRNVEGVGVN